MAHLNQIQTAHTKIVVAPVIGRSRTTFFIQSRIAAALGSSVESAAKNLRSVAVAGLN